LTFGLCLGDFQWCAAGGRNKKNKINAQKYSANLIILSKKYGAYHQSGSRVNINFQVLTLFLVFLKKINHVVPANPEGVRKEVFFETYHFYHTVSSPTK
jgi:hypothetical protein